MNKGMIKIGLKLALGFGVVLILAVSAGLFCVASYLASTNQYREYVADHVGQLDAIHELEINLKDHVQAWKNMLLRGHDLPEFKVYKTKQEELNREILQHVGELTTGHYRLENKEDEKFLGDFAQSYKAMVAKKDEVTASFASTLDYKAADAQVKGIDRGVEQNLFLLSENVKKETEASSRLLAEKVQRKGLVIIVIFIVVMMPGVGVAILITRNITKPLVSLSGITDIVASGDLTVNVDVRSNDEVGVLAERFRSMIKNLGDILGRVRLAVNQLTSSGSEILAASQQQAAAAREQSSAVSETTAAAKELAVISEQVGDNTKKVSQAAAHTLAGMAKIKESLAQTSKMINSLGEKSQQINKITEVIDDVADQTNLLAVNAAIEAARAGEQGRGFTVVADEIRKLSDSTAKSTKDITALIEIIQHEMSNAVMSMETSVTSIDDEVRLAHQTSESAKEIAMSATQQINGAKQISDAMTSINDAMKEIAAGAQQSQTAAKQLTDLASELKGITGKFKIAA